MGLPMDIFDFDISPTAALGGGVKKLDMGSCAFETGVTEGKVVEPDGNKGEHSFGGGLEYKKGMAEKVVAAVGGKAE